MTFPSIIKEEALVRSRRCCCVCHEFAGVFINVHHIVPESENGPNDLNNVIVLCLRCHGEAGHYNPDHPIGNKYSPNELRRHRNEWWKWCKNNPEAPLHKVPISVSPTTIRLQEREWKVTCHFKIQNRTKEILYDVVVKIGIDSRDISTNDIAITPLTSKEELPLRMGNLTVSANIVKIRAIDESENGAIFLYIKSLDPEEVLTFLLQNNSVKPLPENIQPKASLGICGFSETSTPTITSPGKVALPFRPYEKIKPESISFLMRREMNHHGSADISRSQETSDKKPVDASIRCLRGYGIVPLVNGVCTITGRAVPCLQCEAPEKRMPTPAITRRPGR